MDKKHTPGPWVARQVSGVGLPGQVGWAIDFNEDQEQVVDFVYQEADARLIAAAPELLKALEECVRVHGTDRDGWPIEHGYIGDARAAIAKAKAVQS